MKGGDLAWQDHAACKDIPNRVFFGNTDGSPMMPIAFIEDAKAICKDDCPVRQECLNFAMANNEKYGVWGGLSSTERTTLKRKLQRGSGTRPSHCPSNHLLKGDNLYIDPSGYARCITCRRSAVRRHAGIE